MRHVVALALLVCLLTAAAVGIAAAAAPAPFTIAFVDTERVSGEYKGMQLLNQQFLDFQKEQDGAIQRRQKSRLLFDQEQREYLDRTAATAAPTAERDKRVADLEKLSDDRSKRLLELGTKKDRTPDEEKEYQALDATYKLRSQELSTLQADVQKTLQAKSDEFMKVITDSFDAAVKAVAAEKKLPVVVRKEMVLYGGTDMTEDVIAKLNATPLPVVKMDTPALPTAVAQPAAAAQSGAAATQPAPARPAEKAK